MRSVWNADRNPPHILYTVTLKPEGTTHSQKKGYFGLFFYKHTLSVYGDPSNKVSAARSVECDRCFQEPLSYETSGNIFQVTLHHIPETEILYYTTTETPMPHT
jgi:hypothetical protein